MSNLNIYLITTFQEREKKYHNHRSKSRSYPEKYMVLIIDGMYQAKTNLPNPKLTSKSTSSLWKLCTHLTGAIVHTKSPHGKLVYAFVDILQWPHDSNLTATVIYTVLIDFIKVSVDILMKNLIRAS